MSIPLGSKIRVEVTARPSTAAGEKTLLRLFRKDAGVARHHRHQQAKRPSWERWRRGGKMWHHQMRSEPVASVRPGSSYCIRATLDVLRDLESVKRWVRVTPDTGSA